MAWDFETEPEFEEKLAWMRSFVRDEIIPLEAIADHWRTAEGRAVFAKITDPLKDEVRRQGCGPRTCRPTWAAWGSAR